MAAIRFRRAKKGADDRPDEKNYILVGDDDMRKMFGNPTYEIMRNPPAKPITQEKLEEALARHRKIELRNKSQNKRTSTE